MPYDTRLSTKDEAAFQVWAKRQTNAAGGNVIGDLPVYDVRGLYLALGGKNVDPTKHGTDKYKKPTHPTFSDESIYHSKETPGGRWGNVGGKDVFYASPHNVKTLGVQGLQQFFKENEDGVQLVLPPNISLLDLLGTKK